MRRTLTCLRWMARHRLAVGVTSICSATAFLLGLIAVSGVAAFVLAIVYAVLIALVSILSGWGHRFL